MRGVVIVFWSLQLAALPGTSADDAKPDPYDRPAAQAKLLDAAPTERYVTHH